VNLDVAGVFRELVGQDEAQEVLAEAARGVGMTHAWLFTGPPGSGRSTAAVAFAAALQCPDGGCGDCHTCRTVLGGTHADVTRVIPEGLTLGVDQVRRLILEASRAPTQGRWQVLIVEDADRLTEAAANALLKAVEEPPERTVFLLCAPSTNPAEISVTIRSRCRVMGLRQPPADAIADLLVARDGLDRREAELYAAAAQGHVGRARRLATDAEARAKRHDVLQIPRRLTGLGACFTAAVELIEAAEAEASGVYTERSAAEKEALETALGKGGTGKGASKAARGSAAALKELEKRQKTRDTRAQRDSLDRALVDLAAFYRDALAAGFGARVDPIHIDMADTTRAAAAKLSAESLLRRIDAILECRKAIEANVRPRIAVEAMMTRLWQS
jgi:DNA polymerase-3 subunit delta'